MIIRPLQQLKQGINDVYIEVLSKDEYKENKYWVVVRKGADISNYVSFAELGEAEEFINRFIVDEPVNTGKEGI